MSDHDFPPVNTSAVQLTVRAIITGMTLGAVLSLCNVYSGLKIGWTFNMSVTAVLLSFGFWKVFERFGARKWGPLENNMNQTAASAGASVSSAGLVAPIPALAMLTGQSLSWPLLSLWLFSVMLVGVMVAVGLRRQMLVEEKLPFPYGIATAETIKEMYAQGKEAMSRVTMLVGSAAFAAFLKLSVKLLKIKKAAIPGVITAKAGGVLSAKGIGAITLKNLTIALDPSLLMVGAGGLSNFKTCVSMFFGAAVAWLVVGPAVLELGWAAPGKAAADAMWFGPMVKWMLWPGVAMMVAGSLTSFAFSWRAMISGLSNLRGGSGDEAQRSPHELPRTWFIRGVIAALILSVICQALLFDIAVWIAVVGVLFTFLLAVVAARVSGETGITPVGPMGKVTQLMFGVLAPGSAAANLMAANVTGGASSQAGDLLHDLKTGLMLGSSPRLQALAQLFGIMAGATAGAAAYIVIIPDPKSMLLTEEWPAPAVAQWKAVAEIFMTGLEAMPDGSIMAILCGSTIAVVLAILEKTLPEKMKRWVPSGPSIGLAFCIPATYAITYFAGGVATVILKKYAPTWTDRFWIVVCSGVIAGESLMGVGLAVQKILAG